LSIKSSKKEEILLYLPLSLQHIPGETNFFTKRKGNDHND